MSGLREVGCHLRKFAGSSINTNTRCSCAQRFSAGWVGFSGNCKSSPKVSEGNGERFAAVDTGRVHPAPKP